jgi:TetR/AcrR family fatty acid metabolism transcriptional regulator
MLRDRMTERPTDRRRELLDAAVRVFARKGYRAARVGDIAEEAGVAHGLLETQRIEASGVPLREQLRRFARIYLGSWLMTPELIGVLVREIARSPQVGERVDEIAEVFRGLDRIIGAARDDGEVRADCDATFAAWAVYGSLEEILTGWALGQLPAEEEDVERAVATVVDVAWAGLAA